MNNKKAAACALTLLAATVLAGCANPGANASENKSNGVASNVADSQASVPSNKKITIEWWNNYTEDPTPNDTSDDSNYQAYYYAKNMIEAYTALHPNVTIKTKAYKNYVAIANDVSQGLATGNTPDLAITYGTYAYNWEKYLVDVTSKGKALEKDSDYIQSYLAVEKQQYGGEKYWSLPFGKSTEAMMVNQQVFDAKAGEAAGTQRTDTAKDGSTYVGYPAPVAGSSKVAYTVPETFDGLMTLARQMKTDYPDIFANQKDDSGYFKAVPVIYEDGVNLFCTVMESKGLPYIAAKDSAKEGVLFNTQEARNLFIQLKKWNNEGLICTGDQLTMSGQYHTYASTIFDEGKCFAVLATTRGSKWLVNDGYSIGYERIPKWDSTSTRKVTSQGGSICFFQKKDADQTAAALDFYDFMTSKENSAKLSVMTDYCPVRTSSYETDEIKNAVAKASTLTAASSKADKTSGYTGKVLAISKDYAASNELFMSPVNKYSAKFRTAIDNMVNNIFNSTASTDEAIASLVDSEFTAAYNATIA